MANGKLESGTVVVAFDLASAVADKETGLPVRTSKGRILVDTIKRGCSFTWEGKKYHLGGYLTRDPLASEMTAADIPANTDVLDI